MTARRNTPVQSLCLDKEVDYALDFAVSPAEWDSNR